MYSRRDLLKGLGTIAAGVGIASVSRSALAGVPEVISQTSPDTMPPLIVVAH